MINRTYSRQGMTLIELMMSILVVTLVLDLGNTMLTELMRASKSAGQSSILVDLACDRLRRDLVSPSRLDGNDLITGQARWHLDGRTLMRDRARVCLVDAATWTVVDGMISVHLQPPGLPAREILACR